MRLFLGLPIAPELAQALNLYRSNLTPPAPTTRSSLRKSTKSSKPITRRQPNSQNGKTKK